MDIKLKKILYSIDKIDMRTEKTLFGEENCVFFVLFALLFHYFMKRNRTKNWATDKIQSNMPKQQKIG